MPIQTFGTVYVPSLESRREMQPRVRRVEFGNGQTQRSADGLNSLREVWSLSWNRLNQAGADAIEAFLAARGGYEAFYWTPPGGSQAKWTCASWSRSYVAPNVLQVSATFVQEFDA